MGKMEIEIKCPVCASEHIVKCGKTANKKQKFRCENKECKQKTFLLDYTYNGCKVETKEKIVEMAINASGIRDTARVLHINTKTVMSTLKKQKVF